MKDEFRNNSGFLKTHSVSKEVLIEGVPNFEFPSENTPFFSDAELGIPDRLMLGKRAERYFSEWIKRSSSFELIAENVQIIDQKQTLGEFDFFARRKSDGQIIHIELVYKYYLFDPSVKGAELEHWIGPNRGDRLDFKLDKLRRHQFPLLKTKTAKAHLSTLEMDVDKVEQQVLFLANLFVPKDERIDFNLVNQSGVEGSWMSFEKWDSQEQSGLVFAIPEKKDWFSRELSHTEWMTKKEASSVIQSHFQRKRSPLIYSKSKNGSQRRDFVVWWK